MSMKMRLSSSSLALSWVKRALPSDSQAANASATVDTPRTSGWRVKSQEVSKESQSAVDIWIFSMLNFSTCLLVSINGIALKLLTPKLRDGLIILAK